MVLREILFLADSLDDLISDKLYAPHQTVCYSKTAQDLFSNGSDCVAFVPGRLLFAFATTTVTFLAVSCCRCSMDYRSFGRNCTHDWFAQDSFSEELIHGLF